MKKDTFLYFQDDKNLYMYWQKDESIIKREIVGVDEMFNAKVIATVEGTSITFPKKILEKYNQIKVKSYDKDNNVFEDTALDNTELEKIDIKCLESYEGLTLSFFSKYNIYDRYDLYEVTKNNKKILISSEDFQYNSKKIKEGKKYYVEAFKREEEKYILKAKSDIYTCHIDPIKAYEGKPKISIIIPAYNTDVFLPRTLDSVLFSTQPGLEIIVIDDGSTDKGPEMIDWYSEKYKGIIFGYHQKNQGLSYARNNGVKYANGDFIAFLDSDDLVQQYMYEELYTSIIETKSDIAIGRVLVRHKINDYWLLLDVPNPDNKKYSTFTYEEVIKNRNALSPSNIYFVAVWNKIIRADIAKKHKHSKSNYYEDTAFTRMIYSYCDKFVFAHHAWHIWDQRRRKTTGSYSTDGYRHKWWNLHRKFINSIYYGTRKGNPEKMDWIIYDATNEVYHQVINLKQNYKGSGVYRIYQQATKELNKKYNILKIKQIKEDKVLYKFLKKMLKE
jgi:glycosyltransferase involved in cell wall biosynthesis